MTDTTSALTPDDIAMIDALTAAGTVFPDGPGIVLPSGATRSGEEMRRMTEETRALKAAAPIPAWRNAGRAGFVVGKCGHAVAGSEWRAGFRRCERCG